MDLVRDSAFVPDFLSDVDERLVNLNSALTTLVPGKASNQKQILGAMYRDIHTIKGMSLSFGFSTLARLARIAEELLDAAILLDGKKTMPCLDAEVYLSFSDVLRQMRVSRDEINSTGNSLEEQVGTCLKPMDRLVDKYRHMLEQINRDLGKRMEIWTLPEGLEISTRLFATLHEPLVHLLRNAADHGIEFEALRLLAGKPNYGSIELKWVESEDEFELTVADDGAGINSQKLSEMALLNGLISEAVLEEMSEIEKIKLIFLPGLSSRDLATDISGKGVGMDAVANWAKRVGGTISVTSERGKGTQITLKIPKLPNPSLNNSVAC